MNSYWSICIQKLAKKDLHPGWDFNPGPISALEIVALCHPPPRPLCQWPFFLYWFLKRPKYLIKYDLLNLVTLQKSH